MPTNDDELWYQLTDATEALQRYLRFLDVVVEDRSTRIHHQETAEELREQLQHMENSYGSWDPQLPTELPDGPDFSTLGRIVRNNELKVVMDQLGEEEAALRTCERIETVSMMRLMGSRGEWRYLTRDLDGALSAVVEALDGRQ